MKTQNKRNSGMLLAFLTLLLVVAVVSIVGMIVMKPQPIMLQGQAEANEVRVSGKIPGRIDNFLVSEGMTVHKGDTLVMLQVLRTKKQTKGLVPNRSPEHMRCGRRQKWE